MLRASIEQMQLRCRFATIYVRVRKYTQIWGE